MKSFVGFFEEQTRHEPYHYQQQVAELLDQGRNLILPGDRREIEGKLEGLFGRESNEGGAILVSTQAVEAGIDKERTRISLPQSRRGAEGFLLVPGLSPKSGCGMERE